MAPLSVRFRYLLAVAAVASFGAGAGPSVAAGTNAPAAVPAAIRAVFAKPQYKDSTWALRVEDGSKVLIDYNSAKPLYIGSVRKVFSVGELMNAVGPTHTYDTPIYRTGSVSGGVLHGNLVLVASGDLTMGGRRNPDGTIAVSDWDHNEADSLGNAILTAPDPLAGYRQLAQAVRAAGIRRVAGDVAIDDRLFQPFFFRDQFNVRPIFVNDDLVDVTIAPGGRPGSRANLTSRPQSAALAVKNQLVTGAPNSKDTLKIDPFLPACIGSPNCSAAVTGSLPSNFVPPLTGKPLLVQAVRIVQPANYARTVLVEMLRAAGVTVAAPVVEANPVRLLPAKNSYRRDARVAQLTGMQYGQDAKLILKISYNIGADTSLVLYGLTRGVNSMPAALAVERKTLASQFGVQPSEYHFVDGSGGGETTATGRAVTHMLDGLAKSPAHATFYDDLPILSVDGSLAFVKDFQKDPSLKGAAGQVHAKTGTYVNGSAEGTMLKGQALAGYITTKNERHLTFELVVNDMPLSGIMELTKVFQDQGTIAAILWRDY